MSCPNNEATKLESKKNEECKENCESLNCCYLINYLILLQI